MFPQFRFAILCCLCVAFTQADVSTSKFQVHIPSSLTVPGGYDHRAALFGVFPFGGSIHQKVYYANTTLCDANDVAFARDNSFPRGSADWRQPPFILMVNRGDCSFVQKVRNAQKSGAAAVLIADNICMCQHMETCVLPDDQDTCELQEPFMADDGSGSDISIPAFLLFKTDADAMIATLVVKDQPITAELSFSIPNPEKRVEYDVWTSPGDVMSRDFITSFESAATALASHAFFTPHMDLIDGVFNHCHHAEDVDELLLCEGMCTNQGRYCAQDPDGDASVGASGQDVVVESLRQLCIWQEYGGKDGIGVEWWRYAKAFALECAESGDRDTAFTNDACIANAMKRAGVNANKIDECMAKSGGLENDEPNVLLDEALESKSKDGMIILPTLFVNSAPVRGEFDFRNAFRAICYGFSSDSRPDICNTCVRCHDVEKCVETKSCEDPGHIATTSGVSHVTFFASIIALSCLFGIVGYTLHRRQERYMRDQIRGVMAEYMPVDPSKNMSTSVAEEDDEDNGFAMS